MQDFRNLYDRLELLIRAYQYHVLIPINFIMPAIVVYHSIQYPYRYITEQPDMLFLVSIGSVLNFFLCTRLGEEINQEGFKALLWTAFFNYAAFLVLVVRYYVTYKSERRIKNRESKERLRQLLLIN